MSDAILQAHNLIKSYRLGGEVVTAVSDVSLAATRGEFVAIMGASGSGKTTLLHLIGGIDVPDSGRVVLDGDDITAMNDRQRTLFRRRRMGVVFQAYNLLPHLTARENIMLPMLIDGTRPSQCAARVDELIEHVRLGHRAAHRPDALSGGEQQRVAIARALLTRPAILLADEPTGNLDPANALQIWELLASLASETGTTILMVTHESAAAAHAGRVVVLRDGKSVGQIDTGGSGDATLVATQYAKLAG